MKQWQYPFIAVLLVILSFSLSEAGSRRPGARAPIGPPPGSIPGLAQGRTGIPPLRAIPAGNRHSERKRGIQPFKNVIFVKGSGNPPALY